MFTVVYILTELRVYYFVVLLTIYNSCSKPETGVVCLFTSRVACGFHHIGGYSHYPPVVYSWGYLREKIIAIAVVGLVRADD